jgi:uncharacterized protein (TIGR00369 family)
MTKKQKKSKKDIEKEKSGMKQMNPAYIAQVMLATNACNFFQLMSMRIETLSWGKSELTIATGEKHLQPFGIAHGGVCASIIDAACFWAVFTEVPEDTGLTTVDLKLNYLAPVITSKLFGKGECIKLGRTMGLGKAEIYNSDGNIVAFGSSTVMVLPGMELAGGMPLVPKFI